MPRKTLQVQVELDIQAVTCPGVWLCPNGKISLQVYMLDSCIQTTGLQPVFPLLYHEKFIFYKTFYAARSLNDLHRCINKDFLYAELIQWQNCEMGNVLATFQTSLGDVLYPTAYEGALAGVDVDLLMEPSKNFPGIIAPKIEISTRTTVDEVVCSGNSNKCTSCVVNHKTVQSDQNHCAPKHNPLHQQKVCHSVGYHKARRCSKLRRSSSNKPPFVMRKVEEDLLGRKPQGLESGSTNKCRCCLQSQSTDHILDKRGDFSSSQSLTEKTYTKLTDNFLKQYPKPTKIKSRYTDKGVYPKKMQKCACGSGHSQENCPVCSKYHHYFEGNSTCMCKSPTKMARNKSSPVKDSYVRKVTTSSPTKDHYRQSGRSPVRTVGKEHHRLSGGKGRPCSCVSPKTTQRSSQERRMCDCTSTVNDDNSSKRMCFCSPRKKPSLAEQIHHRLKRTLDCVPTYQSDEQSESDSPAECSCVYYRNCRDEFSKNLGKFYKDLRSC